MKLYIIGKKFGDEHPQVDGFHCAMFHGTNLRSPKDGYKTDYTFFDEIKAPMKLVKNIYKISDLFKPSANFVVSEKLLNLLKGFPHIKFVEVDFAKLFEYPYEENDFSYQFIRGFKDCDSFIKKLRNDRKLIGKIGKYYEMVSARHKDIESLFNDLKTYTLSLDPYDKFDIIDIRLSDRLICEYPIFNKMNKLFNEQIFAILKDLINPTYFYVKEYDLAEGPKPKSRMIM